MATRSSDDRIFCNYIDFIADMTKLDLIRAFAPQIRQIISPHQALSLYVPSFHVSNSFAVCIAHSEKTASMRVGPNFAHCFGCGFHGDSIEIVKRLFRLDTFQAMLKLNDDFALALPIARKLTLREAMEIKERSAQIAMERAALKSDRMEQFEHKLDLEMQLIALQDIAKEFRPTCRDAPFDPLFVYAVAQIELLKYLLDYGF